MNYDKTRGLVYYSLKSSVTERIKHETLSMLTYHSNPVRSRNFNSPQSLMFRDWPALALQKEPTSIPLLWVTVIQTNIRAGAMFPKSA